MTSDCAKQENSGLCSRPTVANMPSLYAPSRATFIGTTPNLGAWQFSFFRAWLWRSW
jgi:hypothetical protein